MADQLPQFQGLNAAGLTGIAGIAMIAEEAAALVAREVAESGGGNYQFHPDELQAVLTEWKGLQQTITSAMKTVHTRTPSSGAEMAPGNESASDSFAGTAHTMNLAYQDYLKSMQTYVTGYVDKLSTALNNYVTTEADNSSLAGSAQSHLQA